jgi:hypothetical protein
MQQEDPDELQLLDESDTKWVNLWRMAARKKKPTTSNHVTILVLSPIETEPVSIKKK